MIFSEKSSRQNYSEALNIIFDSDSKGYEIRVAKNGNIRKADFTDKVIEIIFVRIFHAQRTNHKQLAREAVLCKICNETLPSWKGNFNDAKAYIRAKLPEADLFLRGTHSVNSFDQANFKESVSNTLSKFKEINKTVEKINSALPAEMNIGIENKIFSKNFSVFKTADDKEAAINDIKTLTADKKSKNEKGEVLSDQFIKDLPRICISTQINNGITVKVKRDKNSAETEFNKFCLEIIESNKNLEDKNKYLTKLKYMLSQQLNQSAISTIAVPLKRSIMAKNGRYLDEIIRFSDGMIPTEESDKEKSPIKYALRFDKEKNQIFIRYQDMKLIKSINCDDEAIPICTEYNNDIVSDNNYNYRLTWEIKLDPNKLLEGPDWEGIAVAEFSQLPEMELRIKLSDEDVEPITQ